MKRNSSAHAVTVLTLIALALMQTACAASSPGAQIFATGRGRAGAIPRSSKGGAYSVAGPGCAVCHGGNGGGGNIGPSITRSTLGASRTTTHKPSAQTPNPAPVTEGPWTTTQTVETVRTGKTPEGNYLGGVMPRWQLESQDASALAAYLGTL